jgi:NAD-dependent deacetylase
VRPVTFDERVETIFAHTRASRGPLVVLTGAGISAESGIPTFRGEEGYWTVGSENYHPQQMATRSAFARMPDEVWAWYLYRLGVCRAAAPNAAHQAVVELEAAYGDRFTLITQNIDGLHRRAGSSPERTYEIHGCLESMRCSEECTRERYPLPEPVLPKARGERLSEAELAALRCAACGGRARPHVLWFDETYNEHFFRFESSLRVAQACRLVVVVGTSGGTTLPHHVVSLALASGATVVDVNPMRNPFATLAESAGGRWVQASAIEALPLIVARLV